MIQKLNFSFSSNLKLSQIFWFQCVKIVRIGSFGVILVDIFPAFSRIRTEYGEILPHFPAFGLNTERYGVSLRIQSECRKMRTRTTPNTDTFYVVFMIKKYCFFNWIYFKFELHYLRCVNSKSLLLKFTMGLVTKSIGFLQVLQIVSIFSLKNGLTSDNIYYI